MKPRRSFTLLLACAATSLVFSPLACGGGDEDAAWNSPKDDASAGSAGSSTDASTDVIKTEGSAAGAAGAGATGNGGGAGTSGNAGAGEGGAIVPEAGPDAPLDVSFAYDAPEFDSALTQDSACAATTAEAKPVPLDIYLILDSTGSMGSDCVVGSAGTSKWCHSINSIAGFVNDPSAVGNRMALQFFSDDISSTCSGSHYAVPKVALGLLPGNVQPIIAALNAESPSGTTPTEAALRGITTFTKNNQTPGRVMIGILVTDGLPNVCATSATTLGNIVGNHLAATGIKTFIVGMTGASFTNLETIAAKGGAPAHANYCSGVASCHYYSVGDGDPQAFVAALKEIQQSAIGCTYQMPTSDAGLVNPDKVTVQYTPGGGAMQELTRVDSEAQCVPGAWYYDNNTNPTLISLCKATCDTVQADPNAKVDILLGCLGS